MTLLQGPKDPVLPTLNVSTRCFFLVSKRNVKGFVKGFSLCDEFILRLLSHIYDYSPYITLTPAFWGKTNLREKSFLKENF